MRNYSAFIIAFLSALFFGTATPLSKPLLDYLTSYQLAGLLYLGACVGVILPMRKARTYMPVWQMDRKNKLYLLGAVIFGGILGPLALLSGLRLASAASVSMWLNMEMVATAILGHFIFKDYLTPKSWLAAGGILLAAVLLVINEGVAGIQAGLLVAAACLCWGLDNHFTALIDGITPMQSTFWKGLVAGSTNLGIGIVLAPMPETAWVYPVALGVGVIAYGISIVFYITSAQQLGATRSQLIFSSAPFWGVLLSVLVLREKLEALHIVAFGLLIVSIIFLFREQHVHSHEHSAQRHSHLHQHQDGHHAHHGNELTPDWHIHVHEHPPMSHEHVHMPDLHHRHFHSED